VSNDELTELLVWAYKQGFLDAAQILTESVKSLDDAKIRAQLSEGLEALSKPAAPDKPEAEGSNDPAPTDGPDNRGASLRSGPSTRCLPWPASFQSTPCLSC
jgi:hypothetical protein